MKFNVKQEVFVKWFALVSQAIGAKTTNPILKTVLLEAKENNELSLRANNDFMEISVSFPADVLEVGSCCIDNFSLSMVSKFDVGKDVSFSKAKRLTISQGGRSHRPVYIEPSEFPSKMICEDYQEADNKGFVAVLRKAFVSVSSLSDRPIFQAFHINPETKEIVTGNGDSITLFQEISFGRSVANVPAKIIYPLLNQIEALSKNDKFQISLGEVNGFKGDIWDEESEKFSVRWEIVLNSIQGEFLQGVGTLVKNYLKKEPVLRFSIKKHIIKNALTICAAYHNKASVDGKAYQTVLKHENGELELSMEIKDFSEVKEPLEYDSLEGENFLIWLHSLDLLKGVDSSGQNLEFRFFAKNEPFIILDSEFPNCAYLQTCMVDPKEAN